MDEENKIEAEVVSEQEPSVSETESVDPAPEETVATPENEEVI